LHQNIHQLTFELKAKDHLIALGPHLNQRLQVRSVYYELGLAGSSAVVYLREAVVIKLLEALTKHLPEHLGFLVLDGFRTLETQKALFELIYGQVQEKSPELNHEVILSIVREFVADPYDPKRMGKLPHNSGGSVDLTLYDIHDLALKPIFMGTEFDDPTPASATLYFKDRSEHKQIHELRLTLYNAMLAVGFTNYSAEWWHYDLGSPPWSQKMQIHWYYPSAEQQYLALKEHLP
jgi:D-alanyl-D-alanine dipeptidase